MNTPTIPTAEVRTVTGSTLDECERQLRFGERIVHTSGSRVTGRVVCVVRKEV